MQILRCEPKYFQVAYAINPHMKIGSVDKNSAIKQWQNLGQIYADLGIQALYIDPVENLPDMVFTANQSFPFIQPDGSKAVILSNMKAKERIPEVAHFKTWYEKQNYKVYQIDPQEGIFEGNGDLLLDKTGDFIWGAYGFRTDLKIHDQLAKISGKKLVSLKLIDPKFYHLDVCLALLDSKSALVYKKAFDEESFSKIKEHFMNLIELTEEEANNFAGNAHCPDQKHVILQEGNTRVESELEKFGFQVIALDTSEFIKSGGSVFCMKMELP